MFAEVHVGEDTGIYTARMELLVDVVELLDPI